MIVSFGFQVKNLFTIIFDSLSMPQNFADLITENTSKNDIAIFVAYKYTQSDSHEYKRTTYAMNMSIAY